MPDVTHYVNSFATSWEGWYTHLQPDWRIETLADDDADGMSLTRDPPEDAVISDWPELKKGSQNGFFLLLLSLGWWGLGASDQGEDALGRWGYAFDDLRWVLEFLVSGEADGVESDEEGDGEAEVDGAEALETSNVPAKRTAPTDADHPVSKRFVTHHYSINDLP